MYTVEDATLLDSYIKKYDLPSLFTDFGRYQNRVSLVCFERGEYLYFGSRHITHLYFYLDGRIMVYNHLSNGKSLLLNSVDSFQMLGDLDFFGHPNPYTTVQAVEDTLCAALELGNTRESLLQDPKFLRYACELLCKKLCADSSNNAIGLLSPVEERLASYILMAGEKKRTPGGQERLVMNQNLTEVAELLGCSYRHLQRTLKQFEAEAILAKDRRVCEVLDVPLLQQRASGSLMLHKNPEGGG